MSARELTSRMMTDVGGACVCVFIAGAVYVLTARPWLREAHATERLEAQSTQLEADVLEHRRVTAMAGAALAEIEARVAQESIELSPFSTLTERLTSIGSLATKNGLVIDALTPGRMEESGLSGRVPLTVRGTGNYAGFADFLDALQERDRTIALRGLSLARSGESGEARFELDLVWFVSTGRADVRRTP